MAGFLERFKEVRYRARVFDRELHIFNVEVPDKGQDFITVIVHKELFGIGDKTKIALMINKNIRPKIFGGKIMEIDFDIRDACPLADLLDVIPDFVERISPALKKEKETAQLIAVEGVQALTEPEENVPQEEGEDDRAIDTVIKGGGALIAGMKACYDLKFTADEQKNAAINKVLELSRKHPKLLYWLPKELEIEPEISAIVSQSLIDHVGVRPSYYHAESGARISEKVLAQAKEKTGWETVALILGVLGLVVLAVIVVVWIMRGGAG